MLDGNKHFETFRIQLNAAGVHWCILWSAKRGRGKYDDVFCVSFVGTEFSPAIGTAIIVDYGPRDGFGLYLDNCPAKIDETVALIARPRQPTT